MRDRETQNTIRRRVDAYLAPQCVSRLACEPREKSGITIRPRAEGVSGAEDGIRPRAEGVSATEDGIGPRADGDLRCRERLQYGFGG